MQVWRLTPITSGADNVTGGVTEQLFTRLAFLSPSQTYWALVRRSYYFSPVAGLSVGIYNGLLSVVNTCVLVYASSKTPLAFQRLGWKQYLGFLLFAAGMAFEILPEETRASFKRDPKNRGQVDDTGLHGCAHAPRRSSGGPHGKHQISMPNMLQSYTLSRIAASSGIPTTSVTVSGGPASHWLPCVYRGPSSERPAKSWLAPSALLSDSELRFSPRLSTLQGSITNAVVQGAFQVAYFVFGGVPDIERHMGERYGAKWAAYKQSVPYAFIPYVY